MSDIYSGLIAQMSAAGYPAPPYKAIDNCRARPRKFIPFGRNKYRLVYYLNHDGSEVVQYMDNSNELKPGAYLVGRPAKPLPPEQKAFNKAEDIERKAAEARLIADKQAEYRKVFNNFPVCTASDCQYFIDKGIADISLLPLIDLPRHDGNGNAVIAYRNNTGVLQTYQTLKPATYKPYDKLFVSDLPKSGHYHVIMRKGFNLADCPVIFIGEGYATCVSIFLAMASIYGTNAPYAVICAGDALNLEPVLLSLWEKLKLHAINFVGIVDNDTNKKDGQLNPVNTGVNTWGKIIAKYPDKNIRLFIPHDFENRQPGHSIDANDLHLLYGLDTLADEIVRQCPELLTIY